MTNGTAKVRTNEYQITLFDPVGFAIGDLNAQRYVRDHIKGTDFLSI